MSPPVFKSTSSAKKPLGEFSISISSGEYVFREGELGTEMYILHEGKVEILQKVGGEDKVLAVLEKGDFFGEMSILEDLPRTASARVLADCKLLQINSTTFSQMLRDNPEIAVRMMRKLSRRLREADRQLQDAFSRFGAPPAEAQPEIPAPDRIPEAAAEEPVTERLIHDKSKMEFPFSRGSETTIGRKDPVTGIYPDIDLTPVDGQRSISRRHAKIYRRGGKYFLSEEIGTMNGTFRNAQRLETGVPIEIKPGDELRFGMVVTTFHFD
ncbi:MAG TPA: cyclic nucleotide-binding domain-containing protein [Thermoanaerobaculia bacterium]|nr:cyclic nucleotide-binding domain-containing protein [Thermoanaerobaculia bacterium]